MITMGHTHTAETLETRAPAVGSGAVGLCSATTTSSKGSELLQNGLNAVPSRRPSNENEVGGLIYALGAYDESKYLGVAKAGGDPRARIEQVYRPLLKVRIVDARLAP